MTTLIQANVPSSVHQQFVESAIDAVVGIGNRYQQTNSPPSNADLYNFKATCDTLSQFLSDYKKSVHEKGEPSTPSPASESMDVEEKKIIIARCNSGQKEVSPIPYRTNHSTAISRSLQIPLLKYSKRLLRLSYLLSDSVYSLKVVKSRERNLNRLKLFKNGDSKSSKQS